MKPVRIFISSPGDVAAEREKARVDIAELQKRYTGSLLLEPVFWEDLALGSSNSFQGGIDAVLSTERGVDLAVFILWSRLGSPLGTRILKEDNSEYRSGTEREWDLMVRARERSGGTRPDIFTYIREDQHGFIEAQRGKDLPALRDMVDQRGKVQDFIAEHFTDRETGANTRAFFPFKEPITFAHRLRTHLRARLDEMLVDDDRSAVLWHPAEQGSPFRGLEVFEYEHAPLFFGREQEVCDLQIRLRQQDAAGCAFVLLVGASGSGKSSLARAGVAPAVAQYDREDDAAEWRRAVLTPGANRADLLLGLVRALAAPHALPELAGENLAELAGDLARDPEMTFRHKLRPLFTGNGQLHRRRLLLIFDQIEELFTHGEINAEAPGRLGVVLGVLARSGHVWVLGTIRSDYYARFQAVPGLLALKGEGAHVDLPPPAVAELQRIITQPARAAGMRFEENERGEGLDARLLADAAAHPEALPLLEYCLDVLFQRQAERGDGLLRWADYEAMRRFAVGAGEEAAPGSARAPRAPSGDSPDGAAASDNGTLAGRQSRHAGRVRSPEPEAAAAWEDDAESGLAGALVSQAEAALASLPAEHQRQCLSAVFSKLLDLSTSAERETPVRKTATEAELVRNPYAEQPGPVAELPGARTFLAAFAARRLLVAGAVEGQRTYTVAHEALLRNWWRLRRLQAEQAEFFRLRRQVERAAADWQTADGDDSFLLAEGLPLALAQKLAAQAPELLTAALAEFIARSGARVERQRRRRRRLTTAVIVGLMVLAAGVGVGAWFGFRGKHEAITQARIAEERSKEAGRQTIVAETETAKVQAQIQQAFLSDLATGRNLSAKGNWREALAYFRRAQTYAVPDRSRADAWLWSEVVYGQGDRDSLPQYLLQHEGAVRSAAYSPDGTRIVTASGDKTARQWEAATGKPLGEPLRHEDEVRSAAYSPDGTRIVTASGELDMPSYARQWEAMSGKPLGEPMRHEETVNSAAYSPDGRRVVTASNDNTARQWEAASGKPLGVPLRHEDEVYSAAYSPDGTRILTVSQDGKARQWEVASGKPLGEPLRHEEWFRSAAYSPDGTRIVTTCGDKTARQWEAASGQPLGEPMRHESWVRSAAYSSDGTRIVTTCDDKTARQWEAVSGQPLGVPLRHEETVNSAAYSPDGTSIVTASNDNTARQWEAATGQPLGVPLRYKDGVHSAAYSAAYSPDGTSIVTANGDNTARQWEVATGKPNGAPMRHEGSVNSAAYSPDGTRIVTASNDNTARQWETATGILLGERMRHENWVNSATYSPDGTRIVTASNDKTARQWEAASGKPLGTPLRHESWVRSAAYSPDGRRIVTASSDHTARQWEAASGKPLGEPLRHEAGVLSAAYSPDGTRIVTACDDNTARQWEAATGILLGERMRHEGRVNSAAYSLDGTRIVTASRDGPARQWEAASGKPLGAPLGHEKGVNSAAYSPDGRRIVTACGDAWQWEVRQTGEPPPDWLDDLVAALSGFRFAEDGELLALPAAERLPLREAVVCSWLAAPPLSPDDISTRPLTWDDLARWALAPAAARTTTPGSPLTNKALAERERDSGQERGIRNALALAPDLPLTHLALAAFVQKEDPARADFLRRYELQRLPANDAALAARADAMLQAQGQPSLAETLRRHPELAPKP